MPRLASAWVRSGQPSTFSPMDSRPVGELASMRVRRKSTIGSGTPSATASGSMWAYQTRFTWSWRLPWPGVASSASIALSTAARGPVSPPGRGGEPAGPGAHQGERADLGRLGEQDLPRHQATERVAEQMYPVIELV